MIRMVEGIKATLKGLEMKDSAVILCNAQG